MRLFHRRRPEYYCVDCSRRFVFKRNALKKNGIRVCPYCHGIAYVSVEFMAYLKEDIRLSELMYKKIKRAIDNAR